ncbi:phosphodiester glycosidase family protein [Luteolibacter algae]
MFGVFEKPILSLISLAVISCQPAEPLIRSNSNSPVPDQRYPHPGNPTSPAASSSPATVSPSAVPDGELSRPADKPNISRKTIAGIQFEGVSYDSRTHLLKVIDQANGPGSRFADSASVAHATNALLAINAGFFTPEGAPLGLVISEGKISGGWNSASSLGSGIYRISSAGAASISRRSSRSAVESSKELLQAGPLLVENGKTIGGLDPEKSAVRSILLSDGGTRWWIGRTSSCSLAALGSALGSGSPAPWNVRQALNLDGGRSTDLYISSSISGGPLTRRGLLNRPVRNFFILVSR